ncbi:MAG: KUP/HAK/KT family potassium transporter [Bacteroidota bacterium]
MQDKKQLDAGGHSLDKVSAAGLLVALGIIFGDIGTSPLYVMKAIIGEGNIIHSEVVYGGLSCIFWTLTLQTTLKYVVLTLRADNHGEGGIFALYALVRRYASWLVVPAIIGGAALLADGIITPPISVSSAIEGLRILYPHIPTIPIVLAILTFLFLLQILGTSIVGKAFGPLMFVWFLMLGVLGIVFILHEPQVLKALNPYYAYRLLVLYPGGFWLLGGVFLCTTGAEALYSDLGHCGRGNIRVSWVFVKSCLILNYLGQGAWLTEHIGEKLETNPFYAIMPEGFLIIGITIATIAAVVASQALISGSFTLISEAMRLNLWPKVRVLYPTDVKGQLYVPSINIMLWLGCIGIVLYFKESSQMEAAYGLAITITMIMTTILLSFYLYTRHFHRTIVGGVLLLYLTIETSFLIANLLKFPEGGWVSLLIGCLLAGVMYIWLRAFRITERLTEYVKLDQYIAPLKELSTDTTIPKYATHLIFISNTNRPSQIESKIIYSIFQKRPKRADIYWFVHIDILDEPYTTEYHAQVLEREDLVIVNFRLGFRVEQRISLFLRKVIEEMVANEEVDITSRYESLNKLNVIGDFRFVLLERFLSYENELPFLERITMEIYFFVKQFTESEASAYGLDTSSVKIEKVPLIIKPATNVNLVRV